MAVQLHNDYLPGTRNGNTCSACSCGHRQLRDAHGWRPERIVDFFIQIDYEGFAMLCEQCVLEAAAMLGWVSADVHDRTQALCARLVVERDEARAQADEAKQYAALVTEYRERNAEVFVGVPEPAVVDDLRKVTT